jgi:RHS repeat-associated protein
MPGDKTLTYYYDATGRKLSQVLATSSTVTKKTDYANEYIYENDTLQFINTAEGRYVANAGAVTGGEYQYHLKDHLGNVRLTFSTTQETESNTATLETANEAAEQAKFLRYSNAKRVNSRLFDKTNGSADGFSQRLSGGVNERYGLARSLSVMPGDTVKMEVYAKYVDSDTVNWTSALNVLMGQITDNAGGVVVDGVNYTTSTTTFPYPGLQNTSGSSGTGPKAFLNWLVFDRDYNFITGGYQRMSTSAKENGQDVAHEKLSGQLVATQPGYVYIYLSNEETTPVDVFFDDFKVTQVKSPVLETTDYYPFGLTFNSYRREDLDISSASFNGFEYFLDLTMLLIETDFRSYDPLVGRFNSLDLFEKENHTPYSWALNNPILFAEALGLDTLKSSDPNFNWDNVKPGDVVDGAAVLNEVEVSEQPMSKEERRGLVWVEGYGYFYPGEKVLKRRNGVEGFEDFFGYREVDGKFFDKYGRLSARRMGEAPSFGPGSSLKVVSSVKKFSDLLRIARKVGQSPQIRAELNKLARELAKGNFSAGYGSKSLGFGGIHEMRGAGGARLYFRNAQNGFEILGYSDKATQATVINSLRNIYGQ